VRGQPIGVISPFSFVVVVVVVVRDLIITRSLLCSADDDIVRQQQQQQTNIIILILRESLIVVVVVVEGSTQPICHYIQAINFNDLDRRTLEHCIESNNRRRRMRENERE